MHARVEHLLSLRDGEPVDAAVRTHVAGCAQCTAALAETAELRGRLQALPPVEAPPPRGWHAVLDRKAEREAADRLRLGLTRVAVAASVAVIGVAIAWRMYGTPSGDHRETATAGTTVLITPTTAEQALAHDRLEQLQSQSAALEDMLAVLGDRPVVERAGTALPIDTLEAQVQWIDHQLLDSSADARAAEQLWRGRVEAMNSLVRLRYVEAQRVALL
jgi:hypothetical protein